MFYSLTYLLNLFSVPNVAAFW